MKTQNTQNTQIQMTQEEIKMMLEVLEEMNPKTLPTEGAKSLKRTIENLKTLEA